MFPPGQNEWWFCEEHDCSDSDRVDDLQDRLWIHLWLQQFKVDPLKIRILRDLLWNQTSLPVFRVSSNTLVRQVAELLISGRLHLHKKMEVPAPVSPRETKKYVPFPLSERQPHVPVAPPPLLDPPSFSPDVDFSSQVAALVAAAAEGIPFCPE